MTDRHDAALRAALAERDRLHNEGHEWVRNRLVTSIVEAALAAADAINPPMMRCEESDDLDW